MKMRKKGQVALEFLMTYGWAFLIILVVIGAFVYFDVLSPGRMVPDACNLPSGFSCNDQQVSMANGVTMIVRNSLGESITVNSVDVTYFFGESEETISLVAAPESWPMNAVKTLEGETAGAGLNSDHFAEGDRFIGEVVIEYSKSGSTLTQTAKGSLSVNIQE